MVHDTMECKPLISESTPCGSNKGICRQGITARCCAHDGKWSQWGSCEGEIKPEPEEDCSTWEDDNCDGRINEGCLGKIFDKISIPKP